MGTCPSSLVFPQAVVRIQKSTEHDAVIPRAYATLIDEEVVPQRTNQGVSQGRRSWRKHLMYEHPRDAREVDQL